MLLVLVRAGGSPWIGIRTGRSGGVSRLPGKAGITGCATPGHPRHLLLQSELCRPLSCANLFHLQMTPLPIALRLGVLVQLSHEQSSNALSCAFCQKFLLIPGTVLPMIWTWSFLWSFNAQRPSEEK